MSTNYYVQNIVDIMKETGDWSVKVNKYDHTHGIPKNCDEQRAEFYSYVNSKVFGSDGRVKSLVKIGEDGIVYLVPVAQ